MGIAEEFEQVVAENRRKYIEMVRPFVGDDAEDVVQDGLLKIWEKLPTFNNKNLPALICKIIKNTAIDHMRKAKVRPIKCDLKECNVIVNGPDQGGVGDELISAVEGLSDDHRIVLQLNGDGMTPREIADYLQKNRGTVRSQLYRARAKAQPLLK